MAFSYDPNFTPAPELKLFVGGAVDMPYANAAAVRGDISVYSQAQVDTMVAAASQPLFVGEPDLPYANATAVLTALAGTAVTGTELGRIAGLTSSAQTQITARALAATTVTMSAPLIGSGTLGANLTLGITQASGSTNGYVSSTDWTTFSNKLGSIKLFTGGADLPYANAAAVISALGLGSLYQPLHANLTELAALVDGADGTFLRLTGGNYGWAALVAGDLPNHSAALLTSGTLDAARLPTGIDVVKFADGSISNTEFQYLNGMDTNIRDLLTQLVPMAHTGISASTTQAQGNGLIGSTGNPYWILAFVSTVTNSLDTVTLPAFLARRTVWVINRGVNTLQVFPPSTGNINGLGANVAVTIAAGATGTFGYVKDVAGTITIEGMF